MQNINIEFDKTQLPVKGLLEKGVEGKANLRL